jgi:hypothetical protein
MKPWTWAIILGSALLGAPVAIVMYGAIYHYGAQSEPYLFSEKWVRSSAEITGIVGEIKQTSLSKFGDFSDELRGSTREARVSTLVEGERGSVTAHLLLRKKRSDDEWVVVRCELETPQ